MAKLTSIQTDKKKSIEGIWQLYDMGIECLIAKKPNHNYEEKLRKLSKPYTQLARRGQMPIELDKEITLKAICGTVLLGWKNIEDDDGKVIKFTEKKAIEILSNPEYEDFYNWILINAHSTALYRIEDEEEAGKN